MRKVVFSCAVSLDNYLARADHGFDWIRLSDEAAAVIAEAWETIDTLVMGRRTWEVLQSLGQHENRPAGLRTCVFSTTLNPADRDDVEVVATDPASFVRELKHQPGEDICVMGGGILASALLEADLVDEIGLTVQPVLLGAGVPLFRHMSRQIDLELLECRPFTDGCVLVNYGVVR